MTETAYRVDLSARAALDLQNIYDFIRADEQDAALRWFLGLQQAVFSLAHLPNRGTHTQEDSNLLQVLHGHKPHVYRIIYEVNQTTRSVTVVHIRHGARDRFENLQ